MPMLSRADEGRGYGARQKSTRTITPGPRKQGRDPHMSDLPQGQPGDKTKCPVLLEVLASMSSNRSLCLEALISRSHRIR
eukprot:3719787-Pyramimonas_sp.AAC.1